jgi:hypothetical protein
MVILHVAHVLIRDICNIQHCKKMFNFCPLRFELHLYILFFNLGTWHTYVLVTTFSLHSCQNVMDRNWTFFYNVEYYIYLGSRHVPRVEYKLLTFTEQLSSPPIFMRFVLLDLWFSEQPYFISILPLSIIFHSILEMFRPNSFFFILYYPLKKILQLFYK